jgi:hypothetical protein
MGEPDTPYWFRVFAHEGFAQFHRRPKLPWELIVREDRAVQAAMEKGEHSECMKVKHGEFAIDTALG